MIKTEDVCIKVDLTPSEDKLIKWQLRWLKHVFHRPRVSRDAISIEKN